MKPKKKTGPKPETVKLEVDWRDAMSAAIKKKRPESGWPSLKKKGKKK